jgi:hypothetical protein
MEEREAWGRRCAGACCELDGIAVGMEREDLLNMGDLAEGEVGIARAAHLQAEVARMLTASRDMSSHCFFVACFLFFSNARCLKEQV